LKESEKELQELEGARDPICTTMPSNQSFQGLSHYLKNEVLGHKISTGVASEESGEVKVVAGV